MPKPKPSSIPDPPPPRYHKGNWTDGEILILINCKKKAQLRLKSLHSSTQDTTWNSVAADCVKHGCLRNAPQCKIKWDNLQRDYKKVQKYEVHKHNNAAAATTTSSSKSSTLPSYWAMEGKQRKESNLPISMACEIFQAIESDLPIPIPKKKPVYTTPAGGITPTGGITPFTVTVGPAVSPPLAQQSPPPAGSETSDSSDSSYSSETDRKVRSLVSSIERSASVLAQTLKKCEENKDRRHKHVMKMEERRLQMEETRNELLAGLIPAVNNLSGAIQDFTLNGHNNAT